MSRARLDLNSDSPQATEHLGAVLGRLVGVGDFLLLHGELGAGKTCLVRGLAKGLGQDPARVASPTFVIAHQYDEPRGVPLIHIDAYRLTGVDELEAIGWDRLTDGSAVVAIEWPDRLHAAWPDDQTLAHVRLGATAESDRRITIDAPARWGRRPGWPALAALAGVQSASSACPTCGRPVGPDSSAWPFDTERCRLADLGRWFAGHYTVSRPATAEDQPSG